jgi:hypothetical protein
MRLNGYYRENYTVLTNIGSSEETAPDYHFERT